MQITGESRTEPQNRSPSPRLKRTFLKRNPRSVREEIGIQAVVRMKNSWKICKIVL